MNISKKARADIILISVILVVALIAVGIMLLTRREGNVAVVEINGERVAEYSLSKNGKYELNGGTHSLVIEDGMAYIEQADCPKQVCVNTGRVGSVGQSISCVHYKLVVIILANG